MSKFRVSIIGLGRIAQHYLKILNLRDFNNIVIRQNKNLAYVSILTQVTRIVLEQFGVILIVAVAIFLFSSTHCFFVQ